MSTMTLQECTAILTPLALAMRAEMDGPSYRAYYQTLKKYPAPLLGSAIQIMIDARIREGNVYMPNAIEIGHAAEQARTRLLLQHPYDGCAECEGQKGWSRVLVGGVERVERCGCFTRHQQKLAALGIGDRALALHAGREEG